MQTNIEIAKQIRRKASHSEGEFVLMQHIKEILLFIYKTERYSDRIINFDILCEKLDIENPLIK